MKCVSRATTRLRARTEQRKAAASPLAERQSRGEDICLKDSGPRIG